MRKTNYRAGNARVQNLKRVRALRRDQTDAERKLWQRLRSGQLLGFKFRRQHEFGGFILDFYCPDARPGIELDGSQHLTDQSVSYDAERTRFFGANGIRVLRFLNTAVMAEIDAVLEAILRELIGGS